MRARRLISGIACTLLALSHLSGCGGTGTGNPTTAADTPSGANPGATTGITAPASDILTHLCAKLNACYPSLGTSACQSGVLASTVIDTELGLAAGFGSFQKVIDAENAKTIKANSTAATTCMADLDALLCSSAGVQAAYSTGAPTDFSHVDQMIPTGTSSCPAVYKP
jgi:hypothetical protein